MTNATTNRGHFALYPWTPDLWRDQPEFFFDPIEAPNGPRLVVIQPREGAPVRACTSIGGDWMHMDLTAPALERVALDYDAIRLGRGENGVTAYIWRADGETRHHGALSLFGLAYDLLHFISWSTTAARRAERFRR